MVDYGQALQFGTFLTPDASDPQRVVELALLTEVVGLELATIQDHPYQARFLDAYALMGTILARTSSLRVAANVTNLPLRSPFVLAKTVASLDRLSNGRIELGIGAGAFWDAIAAAGGPRRTPGEALAALEEAVAVVRATWDTGQRSVRVDGDHYGVRGIHPGPAPVHEVEVWIGAIGPRALALTGRVGDGWLPSMAYVAPDTLAERNKRIDDAAVGAGREPAAVRRLYNVNPSSGQGAGLLGRPSDWPEQLAALTLEHGMSTFVLGSDDPALIREYGAVVAPATRELVDAARSGSTVAAAPPEEPFVRPRISASSTGSAPAPTHDDGVRRTDRLPWDDAARPAYSPTGAALAWTAHEQATAQHLRDVHDHLRQEVQQLFHVIDQVAAGVLEAGAARSLISTMAMRQNNWTLGAFCEAYCRLVTTHHTIEDTSMFPHLRRQDPALAPVVDRLEEEHHAIAGVLDGVDRALVALVAAGEGPSAPEALADLRAAVDLVDDTMKSHLAWEESVLMDPLARYGFA
jgi:hypothetical protein